MCNTCAFVVTAVSLYSNLWTCLRLTVQSHPRWWTSPTSWPLRAPIWSWIPPRAGASGRESDHSRVHCCTWRHTMWPGILQTDIPLEPLLQQKTVLPSVPCDTVDESKSFSWGTKWSERSLHQLRWGWEPTDSLCQLVYVRVSFPNFLKTLWQGMFNMHVCDHDACLIQRSLRIVDLATFVQNHGQSAMCQVIGFSPDRFLKKQLFCFTLTNEILKRHGQKQSVSKRKRHERSNSWSKFGVVWPTYWGHTEINAQTIFAYIRAVQRCWLVSFGGSPPSKVEQFQDSPQQSKHQPMVVIQKIPTNQWIYFMIRRCMFVSHGPAMSKEFFLIWCTYAIWASTLTPTAQFFWTSPTTSDMLLVHPEMLGYIVCGYRTENGVRKEAGFQNWFRCDHG